VNRLYSKKVLVVQDLLIEKFRNEFNVLLNASKEDLMKVVDQKIADAILKVRDGKIRYIPGFDGEYGKPIFDDKVEIKKSVVDQKTLSEFKR